jgi:hypothetical protein
MRHIKDPAVYIKRINIKQEVKFAHLSGRKMGEKMGGGNGYLGTVKVEARGAWRAWSNINR